MVEVRVRHPISGKRHMEHSLLMRKKPLVQRTCNRCGKIFFLPAWRTTKGRARYCSPACHVYAKFGDPPVERVCLWCGKKFMAYASLVKKGYGKYCSISCSARMRSKPLSPERLAKLRDGISRATANGRMKKSPQHRRALSESHKEWYKQHPMTEGQKIALVNAGGLCGIRGTVYSEKMTDDIQYRSRYELMCIHRLERDNRVGSYLYEPFRVPYTLDGKRHFTIPDFLVEMVDGRREILEVKPWFACEQAETTAKANAVAEYAGQREWGFRLVGEAFLGIAAAGKYYDSKSTCRRMYE